MLSLKIIEWQRETYSMKSQLWFNLSYRKSSQQGSLYCFLECWYLLVLKAVQENFRCNMIWTINGVLHVYGFMASAPKRISTCHCFTATWRQGSFILPKKNAFRWKLKGEMCLIYVTTFPTETPHAWKHGVYHKLSHASFSTCFVQIVHDIPQSLPSTYLLFYYSEIAPVYSLITSGSNPNPCFVSPQALVYQRWEPCWLVLKCLITWPSLICLPSFWALPVHWQLAALFSWEKWWETSQYTCFTFKICSCSLKLFVACFVTCYERFSIFVKGSICASFHHGWSLPEQALHSYRSQ